MKENELTPLDILANDIYQSCPDLKENYCGDTHCVACLALALYDKDYRKRSKWISVDDRLPEESGEYLTYHNGYYMTLSYSARHKMFNASDDIAKANSAIHTVTHWMPLPEPPEMKGGAE